MRNEKLRGGCAVVLVSGGMDSVAALCWAKRRYDDVVAVLFDYGQPNRDQELISAHRACESLSVERHVIVTADGLARGGILCGVEDHDGLEEGPSPAIVPARNPFFITSAASYACRCFRDDFDVVIGCNREDARRFPDCRPDTLHAAGEMLRLALMREVVVVHPWIDRTKAQILGETHSDDLPLVARSWSCYRGRGPCGSCSACVLRARAFIEAGLRDECAATVMRGGDPGRG